MLGFGPNEGASAIQVDVDIFRTSAGTGNHLHGQNWRLQSELKGFRRSACTSSPTDHVTDPVTDMRLRWSTSSERRIEPGERTAEIVVGSC